MTLRTLIETIKAKDETSELERAFLRSIKLLEGYYDIHDEECRRDHHGYCQSHFLEEDCIVDETKKFLNE